MQRLVPNDPRRRFPIPISAVDDLLPPVRAALIQPASTSQRIIRIPPGAYPIRRSAWLFELSFGWRRTPERFLGFGDDCLTIAEINDDGKVSAAQIPLACLLEIHMETVLLYSSLEFVWMQGKHIETKKIEYNTVGETLIRRQIDRTRAACPTMLAPIPVPPREETLAPLPLKFRNYLRSCLLPGEPLHAAVFQPAIRQTAGTFRPYISPNRAIGITERFVILVEDRQVLRRGERSAERDYAMIEHFYPLQHIEHITLDTTPDVSWLRLHYAQHVQHGGGADVGIPLLPAHAGLLLDALQPATELAC
ncbi:MAG: hypothetical protein EHM39_10630 [Chloroflexi bacterium]|nr:MAG: hypothetical protein EHM39_10630 [Chloroflexota bacterium]